MVEHALYTSEVAAGIEAAKDAAAWRERKVPRLPTDRAVHNSPPPMDDVGGVTMADFDEKDPDRYQCAAAQLEVLKANSPHGAHYRKHGKVQPIDLIESYDLGYNEGEIIAKVSRWKDKNGVEDLEKARWHLERLLIAAKVSRGMLA